MPLLTAPPYRPPLPFRSGHVCTIYPALFPREIEVAYTRTRLHLPDDDFLDIDWLRAGHPRVAVLLHGLEGNTQRGYIRGMARALHRRGWDVAAMNFRGCSGEPNRLLRSYHSGETEDLDFVVRHVLGAGYDEAGLVGFSLGGNVVLKYLGEREGSVPAAVRAAVVFSVPCDLASGAVQLARRTNWIYMRRFLRNLRAKIRDKMPHFPGTLDDAGFERIRTFREFDDRYTAPIHGFADAHDYWRRSSSRFYLGGIRVPTLLVNAVDDPFLPEPCYPLVVARRHRYLHLEMPRYGGHVGFVTGPNGGEYWSEQRAAAFLKAAG